MYFTQHSLYLMEKDLIFFPYPFSYYHKLKHLPLHCSLQILLHQGNRVLWKIHQSLLHQGNRVLRKVHQSLLHQGNRVLRKIHQSLFQKKVILRMRQTKLVKQIVTPTNKTRILKNVHVIKQGAVKRKMLEYLIVGEKVILSIQAKNQMEKVVMRRIFNYLSVVRKLMHFS